MQQTCLVANQESLHPRTPSGRRHAAAQDAEIDLSSSGIITSCHQTIHHYCWDSLEWWSWTLTLLLPELCLIHLLHRSWFTAKDPLSAAETKCEPVNAFNPQCLSNRNWFLFTAKLVLRKLPMAADIEQWFLKHLLCKTAKAVRKCTV